MLDEQQAVQPISQSSWQHRFLGSLQVFQSVQEVFQHKPFMSHVSDESDWLSQNIDSRALPVTLLSSRLLRAKSSLPCSFAHYFIDEVNFFPKKCQVLIYSYFSFPIQYSCSALICQQIFQMILLVFCSRYCQFSFKCF